MKRMFFGLMRLGPSPYSFLSGVFISVSVNLFTADLYPETIGLTNILPIVSGILFFISGIFGILISWNLDEVSRVAITERPSLFEHSEDFEIWKDIVENRKGKLVSLLLCLGIFSLFGLLILTNQALNWIQTILVLLHTQGGN